MFRWLPLVAVLVTATPAAHAQEACVRVTVTAPVVGTNATQWVCVETGRDTDYHSTSAGVAPVVGVTVEYYLPFDLAQRSPQRAAPVEQTRP